MNDRADATQMQLLLPGAACAFGDNFYMTSLFWSARGLTTACRTGDL